jgi:heme/copper-type cytochrome/quinol oxidase subunit 3
MSTRHVLDVSEMPGTALDHRSPIWWGNTLLLFIETAMFGILVAAYFYLRLQFEQWPPPLVSHMPPDGHPLPELPVALAGLAVLIVSAAPMALSDWAALHRRTRLVVWGVALTILLGLGVIVLRWFEFHALKFRWDENAYGSITWLILGMHFTHLIVGTCENSIMLAWVLTHGLDDKHARDIRITAFYWYWIVAIWLILFAIVYFTPRLAGAV